MSIFLCIVCVTVNCSLWWYFKHIERQNVILTRQNKDLEDQVNNTINDELLNKNDKMPSDDYYENNHHHNNNNKKHKNGKSHVALSIVHEDRMNGGQEDNKENKYIVEEDEFDEQIEGSDDSEEKNTENQFRKTKINRRQNNKKENMNLKELKNNNSRDKDKFEMNLLRKYVVEIRDNLQETYDSRVKIPDLCHARRDECTVNDLWKEIDKLKAIIYWYDSAFKGHLSFCDEKCNEIININTMKLKMENIGSQRSGMSLNTFKNKYRRVKLSDDLSVMSLPERNMHIIEVRRNDKDALKQPNYQNLLQKISSLNSVYQEEEKMSKPNYDNYEEWECDICNKTKTALNEILIFEECYHYYCIDCLKYILLKRNTSHKTKCPYNGCNHILTKYEINYIKKAISEDKKEKKVIGSSKKQQTKSKKNNKRKHKSSDKHITSDSELLSDDDQPRTHAIIVRGSKKRKKRRNKSPHDGDDDNTSTDDDDDDDEKVYSLDNLDHYNSDKPKLYRGFSAISGSSARSFGKLYSSKFRQSVSMGYAELLNKLTSTTMAHGASHETAITTSTMIPLREMNEDDDDDDDNKQGDKSVYNATKTNEKLKMVKFLASNYYGQNELFQSPFGIRPVIYCDWISSGKSLKCVEKYIGLEVLTLYSSNRCGSTSSSITTIQTNKFISESKSIILKSLNGNIKNDAIIFCGCGASDAIYKMANVLFGNHTNNKYGKYQGSSTIVFVSIYETDSNIFIWKELGCQVIVIPEDKDNGIGIDLSILERHLKIYTKQSAMRSKYNLLIGSFIAVSNVCGIIIKDKEITNLLHKYGALSFWDYSCGAPYLDVNINNKDAIFISSHRFIGGPQSMGILCAKKRLFENYIPVKPQNGTLFFSYGTQDGQYQYLDNIDNIEEREESGTINIIGAIRSAISFMIKDTISTSFIKLKHEYNLSYFLKQCGNIKNLKIIGYTRNRKLIKNRLPIISFEIKYKNKFLHYNFVAALMNDLFGIQGSGGSGNCGMYCKYSLNLTDDEMQHMIKQMSQYKNELSRPGYYRLNLHFTLTQNELEYITKAVKYICQNGWKFLPIYTIDIESGNYYHRNNNLGTNSSLRSLLDIHIDRKTGKLLWKDNHLRLKANELEKNLDTYFKFADNELKNLKKILPTKKQIGLEKKVRDKHSWYWLPSEMFPYVVEYAFKDVINHNNKYIE